MEITNLRKELVIMIAKTNVTYDKEEDRIDLELEDPIKTKRVSKLTLHESIAELSIKRLVSSGFGPYLDLFRNCFGLIHESKVTGCPRQIQW